MFYQNGFWLLHFMKHQTLCWAFQPRRQPKTVTVLRDSCLFTYSQQSGQWRVFLYQTAVASMSDWQHFYTAANKLKQTYVSSSKISISDVPPINQVLWLVVTEQSGVTTTHVLPMGSALVWGQLYFFIVKCGIAHFLCAMCRLCAYSKIGHHHHP